MTQLPLLLAAACALIDPDGRVLIAERPAGKDMAGLWEFPGGKVEKGERPEDTIIRELQEELGIVVRESMSGAVRVRFVQLRDVSSSHAIVPVPALGGSSLPARIASHQMGAPARSYRLSHAARGFASHSAFARSHLKAFARDTNGATAIEYALIATIITVGIITALTSIGSTLKSTFNAVAAGF